MSGSRGLSQGILSKLKNMIITILLFFLYCGCGHEEPALIAEGESNDDTSQVTTAGVSTPFDSLLQSKLIKIVGSGDFSGTVIITAKDGRQFSFSNGYADFEKKILNSDSILYQIASLTKIFTALAASDLEKAGKLKFSDPFTKHLKSKLPYNNISIRNLLDHTAGLPDYIDIVGKYWKGKSGPENEEIFQLYRDNKVAVKSPPGKFFSYSNINYIILSSIVENISGISFERYVRELKGEGWTGLQVLGNNETNWDSGKLAIAYLSTGKKYSKVPPGIIIPFEKRKGSGGLWTTPFNFNEWLSTMFFKLDFYKTTLTEKKTMAKVGSSNYVLGWYVVKKKGSEYIYCYGKNPGMNSFCAYLPDKEIIITLFSNTEIDSKSKGEQFVSALIQ